MTTPHVASTTEAALWHAFAAYERLALGEEVGAYRSDNDYSDRHERATALLLAGHVRAGAMPHIWHVRSLTRRGVEHTVFLGEPPDCSCEDRSKGGYCSHTLAAMRAYAIREGLAAAGYEGEIDNNEFESDIDALYGEE